MEFCFSFYVQELQKMHFENISQEDLVNLLIKYLVDLVGLESKSGYTFYLDKKQVSSLIRRKSNISPKIRSALGNKKINQSEFLEFFNKRIYSKLIPNEIEIRCNNIWNELKSSNQVSETVRLELSEFINQRKYSYFLLFALELSLSSFPNKKVQLSDEDLENEAAVQKKINLQKDEIPTVIQKNEEPYLSAIIDAISEKENNSLTMEILQKEGRYTKNIDRHRSEFFAAEYVRRQAREMFDENEDPFDDLQEELLDGIIYTVEKEYENGYERLKSSLEQAANVQIDSNPLIREEYLVTVKAKQGVCHTLINDNKLEGWTNDKYS